MGLGKQTSFYLNKLGMTVKELSERSGVDTKAIYAIISRDNDTSIHGAALARGFGLSYERFSDPARNHGPIDELTDSKSLSEYIITPHENANENEFRSIKRVAAIGSCGGGRFNQEPLEKTPLIKELSFFTKYRLNPENAIAIKADGDSMADFIIDGDIVIFDYSKTIPITGKIFLIDHPDGLRIKELRKNIDGSITLSSRNPNKTLFPDEVILPNQLDLLKICGEFVYRQGG